MLNTMLPLELELELELVDAFDRLLLDSDDCELLTVPLLSKPPLLGPSSAFLRRPYSSSQSSKLLSVMSTSFSMYVNKSGLIVCCCKITFFTV